MGKRRARRVIVDMLLYTGQHLQSVVTDVGAARATSDDMVSRAMVETAQIIDVDTGEVVNIQATRAARWR